MENTNLSRHILKKLALHHRRLDGLTLRRKAYYILQVLFGELVRRRGFFGPRLLEITLTHLCQCRCVHCYDATNTPFSNADSLKTVEVFSILDQAVSMGCTEVCFTGGEPLLREDLLDLIRYSRRLQLVTKINTNGLLLSRGMVSELKKAGLACCFVSIDSPDPEVHNMLRGHANCHESALKGLRELVSQGIAASITTYARRESIHNGELQQIIDLAHELDLETVRILFPVPMGGFFDDQSKVLNFEERERVRQYLNDPIVTMESQKEGTRCTAAVTKLNILPDGAVTPCVFVPKDYGNIRKDSLESIWERMTEFDRLCKPKGQCPMCDREFRRKLLAEPASTNPATTVKWS